MSINKLLGKRRGITGLEKAIIRVAFQIAQRHFPLLYYTGVPDSREGSVSYLLQYEQGKFCSTR